MTSMTRGGERNVYCSLVRLFELFAEPRQEWAPHVVKTGAVAPTKMVRGPEKWSTSRQNKNVGTMSETLDPAVMPVMSDGLNGVRAHPYSDYELFISRGKDQRSCAYVRRRQRRP